MQIPEFAKMQLDDEREALQELRATIKSETQLRLIDMHLHWLCDAESSYSELDTDEYPKRFQACILSLCVEFRSEIDALILRHGPHFGAIGV